MIGAPPDTVHPEAAPPTHVIAPLIASLEGGRVAVGGVVAEEIVRVEVELGDGRVLEAPVYEAPPTLEADVDFFLLAVPTDDAASPPGGITRALRAYGGGEELIERLPILPPAE